MKDWEIVEKSERRILKKIISGHVRYFHFLTLPCNSATVWRETQQAKDFSRWPLTTPNAYILHARAHLRCTKSGMWRRVVTVVDASTVRCRSFQSCRLICVFNTFTWRFLSIQPRGKNSHAQHVAFFKINFNAIRNSLADFTVEKMKYYDIISYESHLQYILF